MVGLTSAWLAVEMLTRVRTSYILTGSEGGREGGREGVRGDEMMAEWIINPPRVAS